MGVRGIIAATWFLALLLESCGDGSEGIKGFDRLVYVPRYASGFRIDGVEGRESVLITVTNPWQGADSVTTQLLVVRGGERVPKGFKGQVIVGEARRIVTMSSSYIAMLDVIGEARRIVGVSGLGYVTNKGILARRDSVGDVGYEGNINYERLLSLNPDLVLLYGVNGASSVERKLEEMEIPYMYVGEYVEESPLGKAEWMVAVAEAVGQRKKGEEVFRGIPERYNALKKRVFEAGQKRPRVMINTPYMDVWFMPSRGSYMAQLIADAGGEYVYGTNSANKSLAIDVEEAYLLVAGADKWINVGQAKSMAEMRRLYPKFADTKPMREEEVYNMTQRGTSGGGNDYWESGVIRPDVVLRDMVKIFHPALVEADSFVYYGRLR